MAKLFCYNCSVDTDFAKNGKKSYCNLCGLTEAAGKKLRNSEKKELSLPVIPYQKDVKQLEPAFCHACHQITQHEFSSGKLWCNTCGRNESAAKSFANTLQQQNIGGESYLDSAIMTGIKATLLVALFPLSLLYLVVVYGFDGATRIIKDVISDALLASAQIGIIFLILIVIILAFTNKI
jgi:hypothetical protein